MNERLSRVYLAFPLGRSEFICECGDPVCTNPIVLTDAEYEAVRGHPTRFAVETGHEISGVERVVSANDHFTVVEKPLTP